MNDLKKTIKVGNLTVNRIGLGTNRITDTDAAKELLKQAVELGINFIDTADTYQDGQSETAIGNALSPYKSGLLIATKGGMVRGSDPDNSPEYLKQALEKSFKRLKVQSVELYQLHRINPKFDIRETMKVLKNMQEEGKIKNIGLSEVSIEQIKQAQEIVPIVSVQNQYSLSERKHEFVLDYCEQNNIVFIPWFPLGRGQAPSDQLLKIAEEYKTTPQQMALAWLLKRSPVMLPIPGTLSVEHLKENLKAMDIQLSDENFDAL